MRAMGGVAQPPPLAILQQQLLAQQRARQLRQIGAQAAVLGDGRPQRIGGEIGMPAHGLKQAHRPGEIRLKLERVGRRAGDAAHDQVDRHQAVQRLERHAAVGDAQVSALHEQETEVAGEVGMAEEIVVARSGRQQRDGGVRAIGATHQRRSEPLEERRLAQRLAGREDVAGDIRVHHAVGERIADAGGRLGVRVDDAPAPVGGAGDVGGEELDEAVRGLQLVAGPQVRRVGEDELVRDGPRRQEPLRPVQVGEEALEQAGALHQGALEPAPLLGGDDQRDEIDPPRLGSGARIGEQIVGYPRLPHLGVDLLHAQSAGLGRERLQLAQQRRPVRLDGAGRVDELVEAVRRADG